MPDAESDVATALDQIRSELARRRSSLLKTRSDSTALSRRTRQLCEEMSIAISASRRRVAALVESAAAQEPRAASHRASRFTPLGTMENAAKHVTAELGPGLPRARLRRLMAHIDANIGRSIPVRELAAIACMSPSHFTALFRRSTGATPHAYVLQLRMDRSRTLLCDDSLSLSEIAHRLGFSSQAHFTTAFRKRFGHTPSACRARQRAFISPAPD